MKERPIIFNAEMVRAILDGRKTQTRRVMSNQPCSLPGETIFVQKKDDGLNFRWAGDLSNDTSGWFTCPIGKVGDHLWVRETFQGPLFDYDQAQAYHRDPSKFEMAKYCVYRADDTPSPEYYDADDNLRQGWKPSIHMPRWASRITLEITDVRVERLNDISNDDAKAEGCWYGRGGGVPDEAVTASDHFPTLWESIYGKGSWDTNSWVWVIEFKRV